MPKLYANDFIWISCEIRVQLISGADSWYSVVKATLKWSFDDPGQIAAQIRFCYSTDIYIYIYIYIFMCVCCVCVWVRACVRVRVCVCVCEISVDMKSLLSRRGILIRDRQGLSDRDYPIVSLESPADVRLVTAIHLQRLQLCVWISHGISDIGGVTC